jgi:hypothetical protein
MKPLALVSLLTIALGCKSALTTEQRELDAARSAWQEVAWSSYQYQLTEQCFCG